MQYANSNEVMVRRRHSPVPPCLTNSSRSLPSTILNFDRRYTDHQMNSLEDYVTNGDDRSGSQDTVENGDSSGPSDHQAPTQSGVRRVTGQREPGGLHRHRQCSWPVIGGTPITEPTAIALRRIVFGQCPTSIRAEFFTRGPGLLFREADREMGFALTLGNAAFVPVIRSILMVIQAHILRALLFEVRSSCFYRPNPMTPSPMMQQDALCTAFTDMMWRAGGSQSCVVCLPHLTLCHVPESEVYNKDGVTEKLHLFSFDNRESLYQLFRRYISIFQQDPGPALILLLYSLILSRGIETVLEDMGARFVKGTSIYQENLLSYSGDINFRTLNLFLIGRASPYLHNGTRYHENEDNILVAETGVPMRSSIGLLLWMRTEEKTAAYQLGSRLKTPLFPIWLIISSDHSGVLFSEDIDLLRDYRSEIRFKLHYYSSTHFQTQPAVLVVRTRLRADETEGHDEPLHILDKIIRTKWEGSRILWNGLSPFL